MAPNRPFPDDPQERNLRRLAAISLSALFVFVAFTCWWLYQGVGYFKDEMSFSSAFGPRKGPRVPLAAGSVPRDGMGYDRAQLGQAPLAVRYAPALAAALYHDQCEFCHAASGRGDAPVGIEYDPRPPDLNLVVTQRSDAQLFAAISQGRATPEIATSPPLGPRWHQFSLYLDEADRRQLVFFLRRSFGPGSANAQAAPATTVADPADHIVGNAPAARHPH
ncbi:MAG: c-type cytochrome [Terriglobales bacterium]